MTTLTLVNSFWGNLGQAKFNFASDTLKAMLANTGVDATKNQKSELTEIAAGAGYTAGGNVLPSLTWTEISTGIWQLTCADFFWLAVGGSIGPFRYVAIYDDTSTNDLLLGFIDYGTSIAITEGNPFNVDIQSTGLFQVGG